MQPSDFIAKYSNKEENLDLIEQINNSVVVSFDIFDTLLVRSVLNPIDLFYFMEEDIKKILGSERSLVFHKLRPLAESITRKNKSAIFQEEVTLDEIYETLKSMAKLSSLEVQKIMELELKFEELALSPREYVKDIYDLCVYLKKKIIIVSDMYLPEDFLKRILHKNGFKNFEYIFVSSSCYLTKHTGRMYSEVISSLKVLPYNILHIGDNYHSDILNASRYNINTFFVPKNIETFQKNNAFLKGTPLFSYTDKAVFAHLINRKYGCPYMNKIPTFLNNGSLFELGYSIYGPLVLGMVIDIIRKCKAMNIKDMVFFERDGYIPMQVFEKIKYFFDSSDIKSSSFFINRNIVNILAVIDYPELFIRYPFKVKTVTVMEMLLPNKNSEEISLLLKNKDIDPNDFIFNVNTQSFSSVFLENYPKYENIKNEFLLYVNEEFKDKNTSSMGTFDIGYQGSSDMILSMLVPEYKNVQHFYLSFKAGYSYHNLNSNSYLEEFFHLNRKASPSSFSEIALSNTLSQKEIALNKGLKNISNYIKNEDREEDLVKIKDLQNGILKFVDDIIDNYGHMLSNFYMSKSFLLYLMSYLDKTHVDDFISISMYDNNSKVVISSVKE